MPLDNLLNHTDVMEFLMTFEYGDFLERIRKEQYPNMEVRVIITKEGEVMFSTYERCLRR